MKEKETRRERKRGERTRESLSLSVPFCDIGGGRLAPSSPVFHSHIHARAEHARSTWKGRFNGRREETWRAYTGSKHEEEYDSGVPHPGFRPKWPLLHASVCILERVHSSRPVLRVGTRIETYVCVRSGKALSRVSIVRCIWGIISFLFRNDWKKSMKGK